MKFLVTNGSHRISETIENGGKPIVIGRNVDRGGIVEDSQDLAALYPEKFMRVQDDAVAVKVTEDSAEVSENDADYSAMSLPQLRKIAEDLGIDLTGATTKKDVVAAIQVATSE
jgi:Rho termination factor, N-terminal domain